MQIGEAFDEILEHVADWPPEFCRDDPPGDGTFSVRDHPAEFVEWVMAHDLEQLPARSDRAAARPAARRRSTIGWTTDPNDRRPALEQLLHTELVRIFAGAEVPTCRCIAGTQGARWRRSATRWRWDGDDARRDTARRSTTCSAWCSLALAGGRGARPTSCCASMSAPPRSARCARCRLRTAATTAATCATLDGRSAACPVSVTIGVTAHGLVALGRAGRPGDVPRRVPPGTALPQRAARRRRSERSHDDGWRRSMRRTTARSTWC